MRLLLLAPLLLAGCAVRATDQDYDRMAAQAAPSGLCMVSIYGNAPPSAQRAANNEILSRGLDCNQYRQEAALMYQERSQRAAQADANATAIARQLLTPAPPVQMYQPPPQINCQSYRLGNSVQTTCR